MEGHYFLKGPVWTQPPPLPSTMPLLLCLIFCPLPLRDVSVPSKIGDVSGSAAHLPQSQYWLIVLAKNRYLPIRQDEGYTGWVPLYLHSLRRVCSKAQV